MRGVMIAARSAMGMAAAQVALVRGAWQTHRNGISVAVAVMAHALL
jgi:hypothetical protein